MTRPAPPVWLLDIDGVLNALAREPVTGSWPPDQWVQHVVPADIPGTGRMLLPIFVARPVLEFVARVARSGAAEVIWHSTWREAAVSDLAPVLGLPRLPISVAPEWTQRPESIWWKLPAARRVVESGRRLVWTDDDIAVVADQVGDLDARPDTLLISPEPRVGLAENHLQAIAAFLGLEESDGTDPSRGEPARRRSLFARLLRS